MLKRSEIQETELLLLSRLRILLYCNKKESSEIYTLQRVGQEFKIGKIINQGLVKPPSSEKAE